METKNSLPNESIAKTTVFNLIILDESGSMTDAKEQTIAGCNETLNVIRSTAKDNSDKIRSFVSIYAFQSDGNIPSRYLIKNLKPEDVRNVTDKDYKPWGATPLLDAVGSTLSEMRAVAATHENATGVVTIITDGMENSSQHYTWQQVGQLISQLKELGWTINLIGANVDIEEMGSRMNIDNRMAYRSSREGTREMFEDFRGSMASKMREYYEEDTRKPLQERIEERKRKSRGFFKR